MNRIIYYIPIDKLYCVKVSFVAKLYYLLCIGTFYCIFYYVYVNYVIHYVYVHFIVLFFYV